MSPKLTSFAAGAAVALTMLLGAPAPGQAAPVAGAVVVDQAAVGTPTVQPVYYYYGGHRRYWRHRYWRRHYGYRY